MRSLLRRPLFLSYVRAGRSVALCCALEDLDARKERLLVPWMEPRAFTASFEVSRNAFERWCSAACSSVAESSGALASVDETLDFAMARRGAVLIRRVVLEGMGADVDAVAARVLRARRRDVNFIVNVGWIGSSVGYVFRRSELRGRLGSVEILCWLLSAICCERRASYTPPHSPCVPQVDGIRTSAWLLGLGEIVCF